MKKIITKHIQKQHFVKVSIKDREGHHLTHFGGFIFAQSKTFLFMSDFADFNSDGFVIIRKKDVYEIKHSQNEVFYNKILVAEKIKTATFKREKELNIKLDSFQVLFKQLKVIQNAIIVESNYGKKDRFIIGKVEKVKKKTTQILYFNTIGEYDIKPTPVLYKNITFLRIDSPYAITFQRYTKTV
jgi:hypothetical protein